MDQAHIQFCPECGGDGVVTREVTPNHIIELYCPHCGFLTMLLWQDRALIGTAASHDPDSDAEAW